MYSLTVCVIYFQVTKVRPNDQDAKMKYNECNKVVKKIAFEKAISVDKKEVNIADSINLDAMSKYLIPKNIFTVSSLIG